MNKTAIVMALGLLGALGTDAAWASLAAPGLLPDINGYEVTLANNATFTPTMYFGGLGTAGSNTKGMNAEWVGPTGLPVVAGSKTGETARNTALPSYSGSVGLYDTGGSGSAVTDFALMVSVVGPISNDFGVNLRWTDRTGTLKDQTFDISSFIYQSQVKPGSIAGAGFYPTQTIDQNTPLSRLMFLDLNTGSAGSGYVAVDYSFTGLYADTVAFNMYGYSPTGGNAYPGHPGFSWTNGTVPANSNGYVVYGTATPTPVPPSLLLLGSGLFGLFGFSRKKETA